MILINFSHSCDTTPFGQKSYIDGTILPEETRSKAGYDI
jgi:hypothetical protein